MWREGFISFSVVVLLQGSIQAKTPSSLENLKSKLSDRPEERERKEWMVESLIAQSEAKAIEKIELLIKKAKGSPQEAELHMRRAELYLKRARSAQFFDMNRPTDAGALSVIPQEIQDKKARSFLVEANRSYLQVFDAHPAHPFAPVALFGFAFNLEQLGLPEKSEIYYSRLIHQYPRHSLVEDAQLAMAEISYQKAQFAKALGQYEGIIRQKTMSRVYWYALYKMAWAKYNLKDSEAALDLLEQNLRADTGQRHALSLRGEVLNDWALFASDVLDAKVAYDRLVGLKLTPEELWMITKKIALLYQRHGKPELVLWLFEKLQKSAEQVEQRAEVAFLKGKLAWEQEQWDVAVKSFIQAGEHCERLQWQGSFCQLEWLEGYRGLIKELWTGAEKGHEHLISPLENALNDLVRLLPSSHPERADFLAIRGDFLFKQKRFEFAGDSYEQAFFTSKKKEQLLAAIDSYSEVYKESPSRGGRRLLSLIESFEKTFPSDTDLDGLKIKKAAILIRQKSYEEGFKVLSALEEKRLNKEDQALYRTLLLDYYIHKKDYQEMARLSHKFAAEADTAEEKIKYQELNAQSVVALWGERLDKLKERATAKKDLSEFFEVCKSHVTKTESSRQLWAKLLLLAIDKSREFQLFQHIFLLGELYLQHFPKEEKAEWVAATLLKSADDVADIDLIQKYSTRLLVYKKGKEKKELEQALRELALVRADLPSLEQWIQNQTGGIDEESGRWLQQVLNQAHLNPEVKDWVTRRIEQYRLEPAYSLLVLDKWSRELGQPKQHEALFQKLKPYVSSKQPAVVRAKARWLQGRIFEFELQQVGMKATADRMPLVIDIKTERLEKVLQAYEEVMKWAEPNQAEMILSLEGQERAYGEFIRFAENVTIKNRPIEESLSLRKQLEPLVAEIKSKREKLAQALQKAQKKGSVAYAPASIDSWIPQSPEESIKPKVDQQILWVFGPYFHGRPWECKAQSSKLCEIERGAKDLFTPQWWEALSDQVTLSFPESAWYRSLASRVNGNLSEAEYLLREAKARSQDKADDFDYQWARILAERGELEQAISLWSQLYLRGYPHPQLPVALALQGYQQNNCYKTLAFEKELLSTPKDARDGLLLIMSECFAETRQPEKAETVLNQVQNKNDRFYLQWARYYEVHRSEVSKALSSYKKALSLATESSLKVWLKQKIQWLESRGFEKNADLKMSERRD